MKLRIFALCLLALLAFASAARATTMTISATSIPDWRFTAVGTTVYLEITVDRAFTASDLITRQPGLTSPGGTTAGWRKRVPCTVTSTTLGTGEVVTRLNIPTFSLESTTDAPIGTKDAHYTARFVDSTGRVLATYAGFETWKLPASFATGTSGTWSDIRSFNIGPSQPQYDLTYFSREETLRLINNAVAMSNGVHTVNGLAGPDLAVAVDANLTLAPVGATITLGLGTNATAAVAHAGSASFTSNGVLFGGGAGGFGVTAAPPANSILTGNAGAPAFSQTPVLNTSLTIGVPSSQTGSLVLRNATNANTVTVQSGATGASYTFALPTGPGAAGNLLAGDGTGALSFTGSPSLTSLSTSGNATIGGLTNTRVTFAGVGGLLSGDADLTYDSTNNRISLGTSDSTNALNLANAAYLSGRGTAAAAQLQMVGVATANHWVSGLDDTGVLGAVDAVWLARQGTATAYQYTEAGATPLDPLAPLFLVHTTGLKVMNGWASAYNDSASSNVYSFTVQASSIGTAPVVSFFPQALALAAGARVWAENPNAYVKIDGVGVGSAIVDESDFGALGTSAAQAAFGHVLVAFAGGATPVGVNKAYVQMQIGTGTNAASARVVDGLYFNVGGGQPVSNALINGISTQAAYVGLFTLGQYTTGFDFALSTFSSSSQVRLANGGAASSGIRARNAGNTADFNTVRLASSDYLEYGDANAGLSGMRFLVSSTQDTLRFLPGSGALPGDAGLNQGSPTYQWHQTAIAKRTVPGTSVAVTNGSPTVTGTATAFRTDLAAGSTLTFASQAGTLYTILSVNSDTSITLTANYSGSSSVATAATTDYHAMLVESASGEDWLELDNQHRLVLYGDTNPLLSGQAQGSLEIRDRVTPTKRVQIGYYDAGDYGFVNVANAGIGQKNLILEPSGGNVGIGQVAPTSVLHVLSTGAKAADFIGVKMDNTATSVASFTKLGLDMDETGAWTGNATGIRISGTGALDSSNNRSNYPVVTGSGKNLLGPGFALATIPSAFLHVYSRPTETIVGTASDLVTATVTNGSPTVTGSGTGWSANVLPGMAVQFGADSAVYTVLSVDSNSQVTLSANYAGSNATVESAWVDPPLLKLTNGAATDRLTVYAGGLTVLNGRPRFSPNAATIASANTISIASLIGMPVHITGTTTIKTINGGGAGDVILLIFDGACTVDETGNVLVAGASFAGTANSTLLLFFDGTLGKWVQVGMIN